MAQSRYGRTLAYATALLGIGAATALRFALHPILGEHLIFSVYYLAVSLAAWAGGVRPAVVTAILSGLLANILFSEPLGSLRINSGEEFCALILFLSVSTVIGMLSEVSHRSMDRARVAETQKDDFLAILAHELRNPLAVIHYTNRDELRVGRQGSEGRTEIIDRQVQQLNQMIDDLLDISRVAKGKFRLEFEPLDAAPIVDGALEKVQHLIANRGHQLIVRRTEVQLPLRGDAMRLEQILTNLLGNAAKYTPHNGKIEFHVTAENGCAVFCVRDNGEGIPHEMLSRVFDLYSQIERAMSRSGSGLGIGLALARSLAELHGGTISAASEGENQGSEFTFRLPLDQPATNGSG